MSTKLYRLEFASYDGCNGWSTWYGKDIYTNYADAQEEAQRRYSAYTRCSVVEVNVRGGQG